MREKRRFWYNTKTRQVEEGRWSVWKNRIGPYATRAEAEQALAKAHARNEKWDQENEDWRRPS